MEKYNWIGAERGPRRFLLTSFCSMLYLPIFFPSPSAPRSRIERAFCLFCGYTFIFPTLVFTFFFWLLFCLVFIDCIFTLVFVLIFDCFVSHWRSRNHDSSLVARRQKDCYSRTLLCRHHGCSYIVCENTLTKLSKLLFYNSNIWNTRWVSRSAIPVVDRET